MTLFERAVTEPSVSFSRLLSGSRPPVTGAASLDLAGYVDEKDGRHLYLIQAPMTGVPVELTEATEWRGQITDVRHIK